MLLAGAPIEWNLASERYTPAAKTAKTPEPVSLMSTVTARACGGDGCAIVAA